MTWINNHPIVIPMFGVMPLMAESALLNVIELTIPNHIRVVILSNVDDAINVEGMPFFQPYPNSCK